MKVTAPIARSRSSRLLCRCDAGKKVLIIGGTGRVGSSAAEALLKADPSVQITVSGRDAARLGDAKSRRPALAGVAFESCDIERPETLSKVLKGKDLVIHTAGPFQRRASCSVLEAAIASGVPYMDVCDDLEYSKKARALHARAEAAGVPAITTTGIYPGVSNVIAAHIVSVLKKDYAPDGKPLSDSDRQGGSPPGRILLSYFTAGSGGAGPTILASTFLLAGEDAVAYKDGKRVTLPSVTERRVVDFGPGVGRKALYLYSLPEVESLQQITGTPAISARFGTDPDVWNWAMWLMARVAGPLISSIDNVKPLVALSSPLVRAVDGIVGEKVAMRIEVETLDGKASAGLYVHRRLSDAVGTCTAAFAANMLAGATRPGVWFPEQLEAVPDRRGLLLAASPGVSRFEVNRPVWQLEGEPIQLGMGMYL